MAQRYFDSVWLHTGKGLSFFSNEISFVQNQVNSNEDTIELLTFPTIENNSHGSGVSFCFIALR